MSSSCSLREIIPAPTPLDEPEWYAILTRSRHEKTVANQLQNCGVTHFLPLINQVHRWSDRRRVVQVPLFPGYLFVQVLSFPEEHVRVLRVDGVVSFVGAHRQGTPIPPVQIENVRRLLDNVPCGEHPFLKIGQRVRIRGGCLDGMEGILTGRNGSRTLVISVDAIQRSLAIRVEGYDVQPV